MPVSLQTERIFILLLASVSCALCGALGAGLEPLPRPALGPRGAERERALQSSLFRLLEPPMRLVAAITARMLTSLPAWPVLRARARSQIERSGNHLGLSPEELIALSVMGSALAALACGALVHAGLDLSLIARLTATALVGAAPWLLLLDRARARERAIARRLPVLLDLLALCMTAGTDFASALALALRELDEPEHPLTQELARVGHDLALGRSRQHAFLQLAQRVPVAAVQELVALCVQAEQKGTPLSEVLALAASAARNRRSVLAEEAAARAAVMLLAPLGLLMLAILLVMFAPFLINGIGA